MGFPIMSPIFTTLPALTILFWIFLLATKVNVQTGRFSQCHAVSARDSCSESTTAQSASRLHYTRAELLGAKAAPSRLPPDLITRLKECGVGYNLPRTKRPCRGGTRKRKNIQVITGARSISADPVSPHDDRYQVIPSAGSRKPNLISIPLQNLDRLPHQLCLCTHNARSVGTADKRSNITDVIYDRDIDVM